MTQEFQSILNSEAMQKALPHILVGGAGALAGGVASAKRNRKETRTQHLGRVLRNALIAGGLSAGGSYAIGKGLEKTVGNVDKKNPGTGGRDNEGPLSSTLRGLAFSPATAALSGAAGLTLTHDMKGAIGAGNQDRADALARFAAETKVDPTLLKEVKTSDDVAALVAKGSKSLSPEELDKLRRAAGLTSSARPGGTVPAGLFRTVLSNATRKGPLSTFGQTTRRRVGRSGLGLVAASVPALAGALLTSDGE